MSLRRVGLPVAVCALALLSFSAQAQNVFAPSDDSDSSAAAPSPLFSAPPPSTPNNGGNSGSGSIFAPSANTVTPRTTLPQAQIQVPQIQRQSQQPVPPGQRNEFAYRVLGVEVPKNTGVQADPLANYTPEQIATARAGFAAMEASNPEMAARNPFRQINSMNATQKAQDAMVDRAKAACDTQSFNIMVSSQSFMRAPGSADGLSKNGVALVGNLLQDICSDRDMRAKVTNSVPMITIVNRKGGQPGVDVNDGIITLSADFGSDQPPAYAPLRAQFAKAVDDTDKFMNTPTPNPGQ